VAESLDTGSAAGRLVITIMGAVSLWEREAIGERTREALRHKGSKRERVGNIGYGFRLAADGVHVEECPLGIGGAFGDLPIAERRAEHARNCGGTEHPRIPHASWHGLAT
jgi:hypothetical protein